MPQKKTIIQNEIKTLRARHSMTQEDLANTVGVSRQTIIAIEANKYSPSLGLAFAIAEALDVVITDVFHSNSSLAD